MERPVMNSLWDQFNPHDHSPQEYSAAMVVYTGELFHELCSYINNTKYGEGYEFNFQLWNNMYTIFIQKDDVELYSVSEDTPCEALEKALVYLKRIKAAKP